MITVALILIVAVLIANTTLPENSYTNDLCKSWGRSALRALVFLTVSLCANFNTSWWIQTAIGALAVFVITAIGDSRIHKKMGRYLLMIGSQFLIVGLLFAWHYDLVNVHDIYNQVSGYEINSVILKYGLAYLLCLAPANILIQSLLDYFRVDQNSKGSQQSLLKGGRFMGSLERVLTLTLVILGHYESIGLLIAAKSIIRTRDIQADSEYIIIGNLLSFGIAMGIGIALLFSLTR